MTYGGEGHEWARAPFQKTSRFHLIELTQRTAPLNTHTAPVGISSNKSTVSLQQQIDGFLGSTRRLGLFRSASSSAQRGWISERPLPVCVLLSATSALIPLVVIANAEKHNYHKNQTIQMQTTKTVGWATSTKHRYRSSYYSANGDYRQAHSSQTHSQPLRAYKFIAIY